MELRNVTAIIRRSVLDKVEHRLQAMDVKGISVTWVKGYGEHKDFFRRDWMVEHVRLEIFAQRARAAEIASAIMEEAYAGFAGDGLIAILPVERMYRIRAKREFLEDEL